MKIADFDYQFPAELIAQQPAPRRDQSRMMVVRREGRRIDHTVFHDFHLQLQKGDVLVINDSRVIPARLIGKKATGGKVEVLLLSRKESAHPDQQTWETLLKPAKGIKPGTVILFADGSRVTVQEKVSATKWLLDFATPAPFEEFLERTGLPPLPPYIKRPADTAFSGTDKERYQTIYARFPGSVAAPTAGLHFSPQVMAAIAGRGIPTARITLHVGYGTFRPIERENVEEHQMEEECYEVSPEAAELINSAARVIAVGTTCTRTLEGAADERGRIKAGMGATNLFIYPGYRFKRVGALLTNFHLPKSTPYLLVCTFAGHDLIKGAYREAIEQR